MEKSYTVQNVTDIKKVVKSVLKILKVKRINIVLLIGELGSGKTTFVKCIGELLGIKKSITSPTFLISKEYNLQPTTYNLQLTKLIHYDLYRLRLLSDLEEIGFLEKIADRKNLIIIEWPDKIKKLINLLSKELKDNMLIIKFCHTDKVNKRKIVIKT